MEEEKENNDMGNSPWHRFILEKVAELNVDIETYSEEEYHLFLKGIMKEFNDRYNITV